MKRLFLLSLVAVSAVASATDYTFNSGSITIPTQGPSSPNPISFGVGALDGPISNVRVSFQGLSHTFSDDLGAVLFNPSNVGTWLFDGPGDGNILQSVTWNFDDAAASALPDNGATPSGTYKPGQNQWNDDFTPAGAPAGPYGSSFSVYSGGNATGTWKIFLADFVAGDGGNVQNVALTISTNPVPEPATMAVLGTGALALMRRRRRK